LSLITEIRRLRALAAACLSLALAAVTCYPVQAQGAAPACIAELKKDYGATAGLKAGCDSAKDCTFQAPIGNASALALIDTIAKRAAACFTAAGLKVSKEDKQPVGTTRIFKGGKNAECAVLVSTPTGGIAQGVRAVCK
jgi:hypothetical protein